MALTFEIVYHKTVVDDDIPHLSKLWKEKVHRAIETKLTAHPDLFGKPLRRSLKGYRKLRVGDYRIVFRIQGTRVIIFAILHRSIVYRTLCTH
ncbi:MAG TPA: type II toxin-antitoxin system RelE/ParE family toxin [Ignavibacteria bacterium]|nr:type II toxin-antitoxin system RelE/ParE family toxin [Ignavibacteria bacterium]